MVSIALSIAVAAAAYALAAALAADAPLFFAAAVPALLLLSTHPWACLPLLGLAPRILASTDSALSFALALCGAEHLIWAVYRGRRWNE